MLKLNNRGNLSLIGLLVAVVVLGAMFYFYFGKSSAPVTSVKNDSKLVDQASDKQTVFGKSIDTSKGVDCRERLNQIRTAIKTYEVSSENGTPPPTLKDAGIPVTGDYFICPVSKQPFIYDPAAGTVRCQYASHANF